MKGKCNWCNTEKENELGLCPSCYRFPPINKPELVNDNWEDVAKIIATTKYRMKASKTDIAIYMVDVREVINKLKEKYNISEK